MSSRAEGIFALPTFNEIAWPSEPGSGAVGSRWKSARPVTPDALLRRHRALIAQKHDGSGMRGPGRPRKPAEIEQPILVIARGDPSWGCTRIEGALHHLGFEIGRNTIERVLIENGVAPVPMSWST